MVRLFHVYYPVRSVILLVCEALVLGASFVGAALLVLGPHFLLSLNFKESAIKSTGIIILALLCSHYLDFYELQLAPSKAQIFIRLLTVVGVLSAVLTIIRVVLPKFKIETHVLLVGIMILAAVLIICRQAYAWVIAQPLFREQVYVMGSGNRAKRVVEAIRSRPDLGMEVVGWAGAFGNGSLTRNDFVAAFSDCRQRAPHVDRIILAFQDRRGKMPVLELLNLRLAGTKIEDVGALLEKISGMLEVDTLQPSALIFGEGFNVNKRLAISRRILSIVVAGSALLAALPLIPLIALAVKISSRGPVLFRQKRVGRGDQVFTLYKFRTMRQDAEASTGAVWAIEDDRRVTTIGRFLRQSHLDEIPQLWNVLKNDMGIVGPRPERPEFVQWLTEKIPYYSLRHSIRPGVTGWAQVRYRYAATLEETKRKLEYDLYYIKHMSVALDIFVILETFKVMVAPYLIRSWHKTRVAFRDDMGANMEDQGACIEEKYLAGD